MHYKPRHFDIRELVPPPNELPPLLREVYGRAPDDLFRCFPWQFLVTCDRLRELYGEVTINDWLWFEDPNDPRAFRHSGYRPFDCKEGARLSEHRFFRAADGKFSRVPVAEVWADMQRNPHRPAFEFIERIEAYSGMTWFHFDLGQHARQGVAIRVVTVKNNRAGLPEYIKRAV